MTHPPFFLVVCSFFFNRWAQALATWAACVDRAHQAQKRRAEKERLVRERFELAKDPIKVYGALSIREIFIHKEHCISNLTEKRVFSRRRTSRFEAKGGLDSFAVIF